MNSITPTREFSIFSWMEKNREELTEKVVRAAFQDVLLGLTLSTITAPFVLTRIGLITLFSLPLALTVANAFYRTLSIINPHHCNVFFSYAPAVSFGMVDLSTRQVLIHEGGHALAHKLFYKHVKVSIEVYPLIGGVTKFSRMKDLTEWGLATRREWIGPIISAAGPLATMVVGLPTLILGHYQGGEFGKYLQTSVFLSVLSDAIYALEALSSPTKSSHDFGNLKRAGIHPLTSAATVILIPLLLKGILLLIDAEKDERTSK